MTPAYHYTPAIWAPLVAAVFMGAFAAYCLRRRDVPGALPLAVALLFSVPWLVGSALEVAAIDPATNIAWFQFRTVWQLPTATASMFFALEYAQPGRWLTRRAVSLASILPVLAACALTFAPGLIWDPIVVVPGSAVTFDLTTFGRLIVAYGVGLVLVNTTAFLWLFVRSPQHRWPVAILIFGQVVSRVFYLLNLARPNTPFGFDVGLVALLLPWATDILALFAFRIFDPVPAARQSALEQMRDAVVVFDLKWRVAGLNRAASRIVGGRGKGRTLSEWAPALPEYGSQQHTEVTLGRGDAARRYEVDLSPLADFRGVQIGRLLMLRDVTDERAARERILEQERTLAVLQERERLARRAPRRCGARADCGVPAGERGQSAGRPGRPG